MGPSNVKRWRIRSNQCKVAQQVCPRICLSRTEGNEFLRIRSFCQYWPRKSQRWAELLTSSGKELSSSQLSDWVKGGGLSKQGKGREIPEHKPAKEVVGVSARSARHSSLSRPFGAKSRSRGCLPSKMQKQSRLVYKSVEDSLGSNSIYANHKDANHQRGFRVKRGNVEVESLGMSP